MKKIIVSILILLLSLLALSGCSSANKKTVVVYNWGQYISDGTDNTLNVISAFEKKTGYKVVYRTYESNEELYGLLKNGSIQCDVIIPSDYMISRMIEEGLIQKLNFANIPNYVNIGASYKNLQYDPKNEYSVPYTWGTTGIIYNTKMVKKTVDSWNILWDPDFKGQVLMFRNPRDAFAIALLKLGYSINTTDEKQLRQAADELKKFNRNKQAYVMDEVFDKMEGSNAAIAPYYAGDFFTMRDKNADLAFVHPKEGFNIFVDAMCVPTNAANKAGGEAFINFMLDPKIGKANIDYIEYSTPNTAVYKLLDDDVKNDPISYPSKEALKKGQVMINLPAKTNELMQSLWLEVLNG